MGLWTVQGWWLGYDEETQMRRVQVTCNKHLTKTRLVKSLEIIHTYVVSCTFGKISVQIGIF